MLKKREKQEIRRLLLDKPVTAGLVSETDTHILTVFRMLEFTTVTNSDFRTTSNHDNRLNYSPQIFVFIVSLNVLDILNVNDAFVN